MAQFTVVIPDEDVQALEILLKETGLTAEYVIGTIAVAALKDVLKNPPGSSRKPQPVREVIDDFGGEGSTLPRLPPKHAEDAWGPAGAG